MVEEDFSIYNGAKTTLRKAQIRLLEILIEVDRICKKHDIPYWIDGGTTLGAVRHSGFIPWDDDVDIALLRDDYLRLLEVLPQELPEQFVLQNETSEEHFHMLYSRIVDKNSFSDYGDKRVLIRKKFKYQGLFLDIFYVERGYLPIKRILSRLYYFSFRRYKKRKFKIFWDHMLWPTINLLIMLVRKFSFLIPSNNLIFGYGIPFNREFRKDEIIPPQPIEFEGVKVMGPYKPHEFLERYFGDYMKIPPEEERRTHAERIEVYESNIE